MEALMSCVGIAIACVVIVYMCHIVEYLGFKDIRKFQRQEEATVLAYCGESTAWEGYPSFVGNFYRKKQFHKYLVEVTEKYTEEQIKGYLVTTEQKFQVGDTVTIRFYRNRKHADRIKVVPVDCISWYNKKFWIFTAFFVCLMAVLFLIIK